jgi:GT2 family glycosyltransferase
LLESCLGSIARYRPGGSEVEVVVVDDGSTDDTIAWLSRTYPEFRLVRLEQNIGFAATANAGINAARGEFIQLLNNDTEVTPGWLKAGLAPFADPRVGSVTPLVLVRSEPSRVDSAGDTYSLVGWPCKRGHGQTVRHWADHPPDHVFGASGSTSFYRAEALQKVGGFDPAFGAYYEDVDLAFRLRWAGYECVFAPACRILHDVSATYDHTCPTLQRLMARNAEYLFWADLPARWLVVGLIPHLAFTIAQGLCRLVQGRARPFVLGKIDALRALPTLMARRRQRLDLACASIAPPHFPLKVASVEDFRNHLRRPRKATW